MNPKPETLNPIERPENLRPTPETLNPKPQTLDPSPSFAPVRVSVCLSVSVGACVSVNFFFLRMGLCVAGQGWGVSVRFRVSWPGEFQFRDTKFPSCSTGEGVGLFVHQKYSQKLPKPQGLGSFHLTLSLRVKQVGPVAPESVCW